MFVERRILVKIRCKWIACMSNLCSSVYPAILPSLHSLKHSSNGYCIVSFWLPETQCSRSICTLCVCVSREMDLCGRGSGSHGTVFIPDHNYTKICLEICDWPKGHWHHPSCQWVSFCAAFLWALLHSCVRNFRSCGFNCFSSGHHSPLSLQFSWEFLLWPLISCCFTAEMYLLFSIFCNIFIGHHIC